MRSGSLALWAFGGSACSGGGFVDASSGADCGSLGAGIPLALGVRTTRAARPMSSALTA